ncbi:MAG: hypothetical protein ACXVR1_11270 [Solirubrobacteraceae bacterium]
MELLVAPELVEPVELCEPLEPVDTDALPEPVDAELPAAVDPVPVAPLVPLLMALVAAVVDDWAGVLRARAGSWPVTSTTVITIHTAKNRATEPPITRARILRTRARRASLILMPSTLVMGERIGPGRSNGV